MRDVELQTRDGRFVAIVEIAPFPDEGMPEVVAWGDRVFSRETLQTQPLDQPWVYKEACAVVSFTASPGKPVVVCRGCSEPLRPAAHPGIADGCPCSSPRGVNHGLVPRETCTCIECDPEQTGSVRPQAIDRSMRAVVGEAVGPGVANTEDRGDGQQKGYVVLTAAERARGFVRPVRDTYRHVGIRPKYPTRDLTAEEQERYKGSAYVKFETYPDGSPERVSGSVVGRFWTQKQLESGCGRTTTMGRAIAETYARDPKFYSATFCCTCGTHLPVGEHGEFVWEGTTERVGT